MRSAFIGSLLVLFVASGALSAEVIKGTLKKVDAKKGTITITDEKKKERTFEITDKTKITIQVAAGNIEPKDGLKNPWFARAEKTSGGNTAYRIEVTVETKDKKEVVTKVHLFTPTRREGPGGGGIELRR